MATITGTPRDAAGRPLLIGTDGNGRPTAPYSAILYTNIPEGVGIEVAGDVRLGIPIDLNTVSDGAYSLAGLPDDYPDLQGKVVVKHGRGQGAPKVYDSGWFDITSGDIDVDSVPKVASPVAIETSEVLIAEMTTLRNEAQAAAELAVAPTDTQVASLVPASSGSATSAALSETFVPSVAPEGADGATVGPDLITDTGWTLGTGWTGDFASGFTKTAGNANPLTWTPPFTTGTKNYIVSFQVATPSNADLNYEFSITIGGSYAMVMYEGSFLTHTYTRGIRSTVDGNLVFTPSSLFAGTVSGFSVREVIDTADPQQTYKDSTGATVLEVRSATPALNNIFVGKAAGRSNVSGHQNVVIGQGSYGYATSGFWNAAVGYETLRDNVNGTRNCTLGVFTLERNITGHRNVAIGPYAMRDNTHGFANVAIGVDTFWMNTTGTYNIAIGQAALGESVTGDANVAIGRGALGHADGMSNHIAIGDYASWEIASDTMGSSLAIGRRALRNAVNGGNLAIGFESMLGITTGNGNIAIGQDTLKLGTATLNSVALGRYALTNTTGDRNLAIGMNALAGTSGSNTAARNTALGYGAGAGVQTGADQNVFIGASAGGNVTTGGNNILIGYNAQNIGPTDSYYLNIGATIYGYMSGSTKRIGINVTNPTAKLHLAAGAAAVSGAPLKFTTGGVLLTTPEPGAVEFDGTNLYFTTATGVRKTITAA